MFNLFNALRCFSPEVKIGERDLQEDSDDLLRNKQEISSILYSIEQHRRDSPVPLRILSSDLEHGELLTHFTLEQDGSSMRIRLERDYLFDLPKELTLIAIWNGKMLAFSAYVLLRHSDHEFTLSWPEVLVKGRGRDFYRFHPHADLEVLIHCGEFQTSGRLVDVSEGGLAYILPADKAEHLQEGERFGDAHITLPRFQFNVAGFVVRSHSQLSQSGFSRIGIEFFGVSAVELVHLRRFLLVEWQC